MSEATIAVVNLLAELMRHASRVSTLLAQSQAEGRELTDEELDACFADNAAARQRLVESIARAKSEGR